MPIGRENACLKMCHHIKKNKVIILLKMNENTGAIKAQQVAPSMES
jgi:hypothetical protein